MVKTIIKFGLVGILNTIIDYVIFQIIVYFTHIHNPALLFIASFISGSSAVANSYVCNKKWTFQDKSTDYLKQILRFIGINVVSVTINSLLVALLSSITPPHVIIHGATFSNIIYTKAVAILIVMAVNFVAYKLWVFETKDDSELAKDIIEEAL